VPLPLSITVHEADNVTGLFSGSLTVPLLDAV
jgi:hypothetical protein